MKSWPRVKLRDIAPVVRRQVEILSDANYPELGVRSFGKGTFHKPPLAGIDVGSKRLFRIESGDLIFSNVFAWEGAVAVAKDADHGRFGSHRFITCTVNKDRALPKFICDYLANSEHGLEQLRHASPGGAGRNRTLGLEKLGNIEIPLPSLEQQKAVVSRLERLSTKQRQIDEKIASVELLADRLLLTQFNDAIANAPLRRMADVAPVVRREISVELTGSYPELGIRSFGKGTFHKAPLSGGEVGTKRLFRIEPGDLLFSNVFAWEGAIAVSQSADINRFGSHRFITCCPNVDIATSTFLRYFFLTESGMEQIGEASPGGAGRNRTLGLNKLMALRVPTPSLAKQQAFDGLQTKIASLKGQHAAIRQANNAIVPATMERIFREVA